MMQRKAILTAIVLFVALAARGQQSSAPAPARNTNLGSDANGNPLRLALKTGHVSNYDESKVGQYTLPDPLVLQNGTPVRDARTWLQRRRPEIVRLYETEIFGRIPERTPKVTWQVTGTDSPAGGEAIVRRIVGRIGDRPDAPHIRLTLHAPANARRPVPMILVVSFGGGAAPPAGDPPVGVEILARGWGYANVAYQDIQPDRAGAWSEGVIGATRASLHQPPEDRAPDEWGDISAWAWGISRVLDYLATDKTVNARQIAVHGHSRLGKTVLWASALDPRIAAVYSSCAGEMGSAISRRDWGETVDDMAQNFPYWFAGNFQKWVGRWNEMPVDAHMLIALSAPRPVFLTGGTADQWADPVGEFLAEVAAGPVYRLLGAKDLSISKLPDLDTPVIGGDLGWHYHTGAHAATPGDWKAFLDFLSKYFKTART